MVTVDSSRDWKRLYDEAIHETDRSKLPERITTAQSAILNTIERSIQNPAVGGQCAMDAALRNLKRLARSNSVSSSRISRPR
jgi:hypothetical protein